LFLTARNAKITKKDIITAYDPSLEIFEADYRTKRKP